ncbi:DUF1359 domain-containing protein [Lactococcus lactis]
MIKKWTVCLSIIILVLNFVPNLLQGHQVFAENQKNYKDKVEGNTTIASELVAKLGIEVE